MRIAAMDLGTNTFRILIGEYENGNFEKIYRETNITRLGEGLLQSDLINEKAISRSVSTLKKYRFITEKYNVNKIIAAGTSAFRNALNAETLIKYFHDETGINIDIISGMKEAELTVKGVLNSLKMSLNQFFHLDIGGGSTEISYINNGKIEISNSFELGVVSLAENTHLNNDNLLEMREYIRSILFDNININIESYKNLPLVATSGTPIVIACVLSSLKQFDPSGVNEMKISLKEVDKIKAMFIKDHNSNDLEKYGTLLDGREDLIVPGTLILSETMKFLKNDCMIISESGLLEGLSYP